MSSEEIEELKSTVDIVDVIDAFTPVSGYGRYLDAYCLFHNDINLGNFKIDTTRQTFKCYSCGCYGDALDFLKLMGNTFKDSLSYLKGEKELNGFAIRKSQKAPIAEFLYIKPTHRFTMEDYKHKKYGYPNSVYEYYNIDNEFIGSVLRFKLPDGSKYTPPFNSRICVEEGYRGQRKGVPYGKYYQLGDIEHTYFGFASPKPIYGIEQLNLKPNAPVIWVEGEKCADFLKERLPNSVILSCTGGTNNLEYTDFSCIADRDIYLLPDNDWSHIDRSTGIVKPKEEQPGIKFMLALQASLSKNNKTFWIDTYDTSKPCGWDIADTDWGREEIIKYFKFNLQN